ncbi:MAG: glycosyltransferase [Firmicutes bacterium]|nr:glycosyltransferase [Bacillota bacterium]
MEKQGAILNETLDRRKGKGGSTTRVSGILTTTGARPQSLERALRAMYGQQMPLDEIIVVQDGHHHPTPILPPLPSLRLLSLGNPVGVSAARNAGVAAAQGEVIALCDDDDEWLPGHIVRAYPLAIQHPHPLVYSDALIVFDETGESVPFRFEATADLLSKTNPLIPSTMVFHKSLWSRLNGFDSRFRHYGDWDFALRALAAQIPLTRLSTCTIRYHFSEDSLSAHETVMRDELDQLCARHRLGSLPVANFARMAIDPRWEKWRKSASDPCG